MPYGVIVYGAQNSTLRSIIMLDYPEQPVALAPGEAALRLGPLTVAPSIEQAKTLIFKATNVAPPSGRCGLVVGGKVVGILNADPAIDSTPAGMLVPSDVATIGDLYADGAFQRRYAVVQVGTGRVTSVVYADPATSHAPNLVASETLNVGDTVQLQVKPSAKL